MLAITPTDNITGCKLLSSSQVSVLIIPSLILCGSSGTTIKTDMPATAIAGMILSTKFEVLRINNALKIAGRTINPIYATELLKIGRAHV